MTMREPTFKLTSTEKTLLAEVIAQGEGYGSVGNNARRSAAVLTKSLLKRSVIPDARLRYFTDPELNIGRSASRRQMFERNGTSGDAILGHPHFLKYLRYFIFGPELPPLVVETFKSTLGNVDYLSGSDLPRIAGVVRELVRKHELEPSSAAEEFHKLALELGIEPFQARYFRDAARKVRC
ncbi:hypothetical protein [Oleiharenicola lentus]|uniref:hypothetical protein n=1 Tax=Oleiharenicola lentus TaxID=2508720 RepID=UPI003F67B44A